MNYPIENSLSVIFYKLRANCFLFWHIVRWNLIMVQVKYTVIKSLLSNLNFTHKKCQTRVAKVRALCWALEYVPYACHFPLIRVPILCEFLDCFVQKLNVDAENKTNNVKAKLEIFCLWGWDDCFVSCWAVSGALKEHRTCLGLDLKGPCFLSVEIHLIKMEAWKQEEWKWKRKQE